MDGNRIEYFQKLQTFEMLFHLHSRNEKLGNHRIALVLSGCRSKKMLIPIGFGLGCFGWFLIPPQAWSNADGIG
jgi:hypothetical protein